MTTLAHPVITKVLDMARFTAVLQTGNRNQPSTTHVEAFLDASSKLELH